MTDNDTASALPILMRAQIAAEMELAHASQAALLERYRRALSGISRCATQCPCCRLHREIAEGVLEEPKGLEPSSQPL